LPVTGEEWPPLPVEPESESTEAPETEEAETAP